MTFGNYTFIQHTREGLDLSFLPTRSNGLIYHSHPGRFILVCSTQSQEVFLIDTDTFLEYRRFMNIQRCASYVRRLEPPKPKCLITTCEFCDRNLECNSTSDPICVFCRAKLKKYIQAMLPDLMERNL